MTIKQLLTQADGRNIAEDLDDDKLMAIADEVIRRFTEDMGSMTDWANLIEEGQKLIKQDFRPKSEPFDGAANYKSPILPEAAIRFGDRATLELLNNRNLVKADVIGRDKDGKKADRVDRVTEYMNYQLNYDMPEWRDDQETLLYRLSLVGNLFKKTYFDPFKGRNVSHLVHYPDFAVNQSSVSIESARSFTHILSFDRNDVFERQKSEMWLDVDIYPKVSKEFTKNDDGSNESNNAESPESNEDRFLEQHCYHDIDGDGYAEPVIVTVHENSQKVVRIVARYDETGIRVKYNDSIQSVEEAITDQAKAERKTMAEGTQSALVEGFEADFTDMVVYAIEPTSQITSYPFYPAMDGTFLGFGYFHLSANLAIANNMATNLMLDSGTINTLGGGFTAKGFRRKKGPIRMKIGTWVPTDMSPGDLQNGMLPNPAREASQTLYNLNDKLEGQLRNFTLVAGNEQTAITANTAPTTALAMISEQGIPTSALLLRITEAEGKEFKKLFKLNQRYVDPEQYQMILDDQEANYQQDFDSKQMDIMPTANPEMSSKMQRVQVAEAQMVVMDQVMQAGGNPIAILKNYFEMIGSEIMDQVFPEEGAMTEQEKDQLKQMQEAQEKSNELMEVQISLLKQQVENEGIEAKSLAIKRQVEMKEIATKMQKIMAETALIGEQAETESLQNRITTYTASQQAMLDGIESIQRGSTTNESTPIDNRSALELVT